jgi:hypothetical protein
MMEQNKNEQEEKLLTITPLIPVPIPQKLLTACLKRGEVLKTLVQRYRRSPPGSSRQIAAANHIVTNLDDALWLTYARLKGFVVKEAPGWIRLTDYAVEQGIRPWTALKAAKTGLILNAHERRQGEWFVPIDCNWRPRSYTSKK